MRWKHISDQDNGRFADVFKINNLTYAALRRRDERVINLRPRTDIGQRGALENMIDGKEFEVILLSNCLGLRRVLQQLGSGVGHRCCQQLVGVFFLGFGEQLGLDLFKGPYMSNLTIHQLDNVKAVLSGDDAANLLRLERKGHLLELGHSLAPSEPSYVSALHSGGLVIGLLAGKIGEVCALLEPRQQALRFGPQLVNLVLWLTLSHNQDVADVGALRNPV